MSPQKNNQSLRVNKHYTKKLVENARFLFTRGDESFKILKKAGKIRLK